MSYMSLTNLVQRCLVRLRQVPGITTQAYSEAHIAHLIEECYEQCRMLRWWDHLMLWWTKDLNGTNGQVTVPFNPPLRERMLDVHMIYAGDSNVPLPLADARSNPFRYSGSIPRVVSPLSAVVDPTGSLLFRVYPLTATGKLHVRYRNEPSTLFTDPAAVIPFDATALINGACMKYAIGDGTNPGAVAEFDRAYNERIMQLQKQHDSTPIVLDPRMRHQSEWQEERI